ncbi:MAG: hypothetical protein MUC51_09765 [Anaerolineae bacterium]|nr:hypothetical protein [Anaerolineae bacterium]
MSPDAPQTGKTPPWPPPALTPDETRLALLGVVDFEGDWAALEAATALVVDGPAKASLIRDRLAPMAAQLQGHFAAEVGVLDLLAARHWFDTQPCQSATQPERAGGQKPAAVRLDRGAAGAQEEHA